MIWTAIHGKVSPTIVWALETLSDANEEQGGRNVGLEVHDDLEVVRFDFIDPDGEPCSLCLSTVGGEPGVKP